MDETVSFSLEINTEPAATELRKLSTIGYRTLTIMRQLGFRGNWPEFFSWLQRVISFFNQLRLTAAAVQAATGPIGWGLAVVSMASVAVTVGSSVMDAG